MPQHRQPQEPQAPTSRHAKALSAFDQVYRDHVDRLSRFAQRLCGPGEDARDLVQETFLHAYRKFSHFRGESQISTWLYTIASRTCFRMRRRRKGMPAQEFSFDVGISTAEGDYHLQVPMKGLSPEQALEQEELRQALHAVIATLPKKYRVILVLRDMEGSSAKDVGTIMGLQERAVKSRLHRARLSVRNELQARGLPFP